MPYPGVCRTAYSDRLGTERILHEADLNRYSAKKDGKNQFVLTTLSSELKLVAQRA